MVHNMVRIIASCFYAPVNPINPGVAFIVCDSPVVVFHIFMIAGLFLGVNTKKVNAIIGTIGGQINAKGEEDESEDSTNLNLDKKEG